MLVPVERVEVRALEEALGTTKPSTSSGEGALPGASLTP